MHFTPDPPFINTMVVSVQERRREIGLKKALGAEDGHILTEVVIEAALIAISGGIVGVSGVGVGRTAGATGGGGRGGRRAGGSGGVPHSAAVAPNRRL